MLDDTIHKHLDQMDALKEQIDKEVDEVLAKIDIDELIDDPEGYLLGVVEAVKEDIVDKFAEKAVSLGEEVAKAIEKKDEIIVDESSNPEKNKELLDDKSRS